MITIKKHLEKLKAENNTALIPYVEKIVERGTLTFEEWSSLGKFLDTDQSNRKVLKSCVKIIEYIGDVYIQILKDGEFYYNSKNKGKNLDSLERIVWKEICEKLWCDNC